MSNYLPLLLGEYKTIFIIIINQPTVEVSCPVGYVELQGRAPATYPCLHGF